MVRGKWLEVRGINDCVNGINGTQKTVDDMKWWIFLRAGFYCVCKINLWVIPAVTAGCSCLWVAPEKIYQKKSASTEVGAIFDPPQMY